MVRPQLLGRQDGIGIIMACNYANMFIIYYCLLLSELDVAQSVEHMIKKFDLDAQIVGCN